MCFNAFLMCQLWNSHRKISNIMHYFVNLYSKCSFLVNSRQNINSYSVDFNLGYISCFEFWMSILECQLCIICDSVAKIYATDIIIAISNLQIPFMFNNNKPIEFIGCLLNAKVNWRYKLKFVSLCTTNFIYMMIM